MRRLLSDLLDLLLPLACAACGAAGASLCPGCRAELIRPPSAAHSPSLGLPCWAAGPYDGVRRTLVLQYKERGRVDLAEPLGRVLAGVAEHAARQAAGTPRVARSIVLVPIPSTAAAARARGGCHMRRLAEVAAGAIRAGGAPSAVVPALVVRGRRGDSVGLGAAARAANVSGTLAVRRRAVQRLRGALIVLVDDLVTTGATLGEAARVLGAAGVPASAAAVLAATERRAAAASSRSPSVSTSGRRPPRGGSES